jgi:rifampicin phosphotransferase
VRFIRALNDLTEADIPRAGGKAVQCGRLRRGGYAVPDGFCVLVDGWERPEALQEAEEEVARRPAGVLYAVRSSAPGEDGATASFAGIHETRLDVPAADVTDAVRVCWHSVRTPRAMAYRRGRGLSGDVTTAVLVQEMIEAHAAGVVFTSDPVSGSDDVVIEAARGNGTAIADGRLTPDEYRVRRADRGVTAAGGVLTREEILTLADTALRIEAFFGAPQDIEWCQDGRGLWIVQARPITSRRGADREWTRANLREVLPDIPAPQVTDSVMRAISSGARAYYGRLIDTEHSGPLLRVVCGRMYFNITGFRQLTAIVRMPPAALLRGMGHAGDIRPEDEQVAPVPWSAFVRALPDIARITSIQIRIESVLRRTLAVAREHFERNFSGDPANDADEVIAAKLERSEHLIPRMVETVLALAAVTNYEAAARKTIERTGFDAGELIQAWMAAGTRSVSGQQAFDLLELAAIAAREGGDLAAPCFRQAFDEFLRTYGHRGNYETDWSLPRYADDPSMLLETIRMHVRSVAVPDPAALEAAAAARRDAVWHRYVETVPRWQRPVRLRVTRWWLETTKTRYAWRELCRSEMTRTFGEGRRWHRELARRFVDRRWIDQSDDYYVLLLPEIFTALKTRDGSTFKTLVAQRRADRDEWARVDMPLLLFDSDIPRLTRGVRRHAAGDLRGLCVSRGVVEGETVVMRDPGDFRRMKPGAILVAPATDPSWTPLFTLAAGVIVEVGGTLSHASTVAREYGIPAIANVRGATKFLRDGDRVRLDASAGFVEILQRAGDGR